MYVCVSVHTRCGTLKAKANVKITAGVVTYCYEYDHMPVFYNHPINKILEIWKIDMRICCIYIRLIRHIGLVCVLGIKGEYSTIFCFYYDVELFASDRELQGSYNV